MCGHTKPGMIIVDLVLRVERVRLESEGSPARQPSDRRANGGLSAALTSVTRPQVGLSGTTRREVAVCRPVVLRVQAERGKPGTVFALRARRKGDREVVGKCQTSRHCRGIPADVVRRSSAPSLRWDRRGTRTSSPNPRGACGCRSCPQGLPESASRPDLVELPPERTAEIIPTQILQAQKMRLRGRSRGKQEERSSRDGRLARVATIARVFTPGRRLLFSDRDR